MGFEAVRAYQLSQCFAHLLPCLIAQAMRLPAGAARCSPAPGIVMRRRVQGACAPGNTVFYAMLQSIRCLGLVFVCAVSTFAANTVFSNRTDFLTAVGSTTRAGFGQLGASEHQRATCDRCTRQ